MFNDSGKDDRPFASRLPQATFRGPPYPIFNARQEALDAMEIAMQEAQRERFGPNEPVRTYSTAVPIPGSALETYLDGLDARALRVTGERLNPVSPLDVAEEELDVEEGLVADDLATMWGHPAEAAYKDPALAEVTAEEEERFDLLMSHLSRAPEVIDLNVGGSTPSQYAIPEGSTDLQDLIEYREMNFARGTIFKACYRTGHCDHSDELREINKILWFANRERDRIITRMREANE